MLVRRGFLLSGLAVLLLSGCGKGGGITELAKGADESVPEYLNRLGCNKLFNCRSNVIDYWVSKSTKSSKDEAEKDFSKDYGGSVDECTASENSTDATIESVKNQRISVIDSGYKECERYIKDSTCGDYVTVRYSPVYTPGIAPCDFYRVYKRTP